MRSAHRGLGDGQPMPARARQPGQQRRRAGQRGVRRRGVALGAVGGNQVRRRSAAPRRSSRRPTGSRRRAGRPGRTISCSASSAVSNQRPGRSGSAKCVERDVEQPGGRVQPRRVAGQLIQRQQTGGQRRVVLQDRRAVADPAAEAGPPQPAVDDMQVDERARASALRRRANSGSTERDARLGQRGDRQPVPRGDDLVVAAGLRPGQPGGQQRGRGPARSVPGRRDRRAAAAPSCRARRCRSSVTSKSSAAQRPSSSPSTSRSCAGVQT